MPPTPTDKLPYEPPRASMLGFSPPSLLADLSFPLDADIDIEGYDPEDDF